MKMVIASKMALELNHPAIIGRLSKSTLNEK